MTWLDLPGAMVLIISIAWGVWRGLVREMMSLAGWVIAFLAANLFAAPVSELLPASIARPELRSVVAVVAVFIVPLVLGACAVYVVPERRAVKGVRQRRAARRRRDRAQAVAAAGLRAALEI